MKNLLKYAFVVAAGLLAGSACSSDDTEAAADTKAIAQPQVIVRELTTTGFKLRWEAVEGAASYRYTLNQGTETTTSDCELSFDGLIRQTEYVVAIKACPKNPQAIESNYTYIHVITDQIEKLATPKPVLGSAYASNTVISWDDVPGAASYALTIDGTTTATKDRMVSLSTLQKATEYTATLRAITDDATRFNDSEPASLTFTTSGEDVPPILLVPTNPGADVVTLNFFSTSNVTFYFNVMPASSFITTTPEKIVENWSKAVLDEAMSKGISIQVALASILQSGTSSQQVTMLTPELSYVAFAFGMDLQGKVTTPLYYKSFKTAPNGYSNGPQYGFSNWFQQTYIIQNVIVSPPDNWTNSTFCIWKGNNVAKIRYRQLRTNDQFRVLFPDDSDKSKQALITFLKDDEYAYQLNDSYLPSVNSSVGLQQIMSGLLSGISYTLSALVTSTTGEEVLFVNSVSTKTDAQDKTWFQVDAWVDSKYGPEHNTVLSVLSGVAVSSCRYLIESREDLNLQGIKSAQYGQYIQDHGRQSSDEEVSRINAGNCGYMFADLNPTTEYVVMARVVNLAGDVLVKWASVTTKAAPAPVSMRSRTAGCTPKCQPVEGIFLQPEQLIQVTGYTPTAIPNN